MRKQYYPHLQDKDKMSKYTSVCFTLNNPTEAISWPSFVSYGVYQREKGAEGTEHFQGYAELSSQQRLSALKKWLPTAHFEKRKGTAQQARDYCMKRDETYMEGPWEHGEFKLPTAGKRTDLDEVARLIEEEGLDAARQAYPGQFIRYHKGFQAYAQACKKRPRDAGFEPRPWQEHVLRVLREEPNPRHIIWVHETRGNVGKSRLSHFLKCEMGAVELHGKVADMAHGYNDEPIVVFDVSRTQGDNMKHLYEFAEKLKNGSFFSPKYESGMKIFSPPHVVFFANFAPPSDAWSEDRVVNFDLHCPKWHKL